MLINAPSLAKQRYPRLMRSRHLDQAEVHALPNKSKDLADRTCFEALPILHSSMTLMRTTLFCRCRPLHQSPAGSGSWLFTTRHFLDDAVPFSTPMWSLILRHLHCGHRKWLRSLCSMQALRCRWRTASLRMTLMVPFSLRSSRRTFVSSTSLPLASEQEFGIKSRLSVTVSRRPQDQRRPSRRYLAVKCDARRRRATDRT